MQLFLRILFFSLICGSNFGVFAQKDTVLQRLLSIQSVKKQIDAFNYETANCWRTGAYERGLVYGRKTLQLAKKRHYLKAEAEAYNNIGIIYDYQGNYTESLTNYFKALPIQEDIDDQKGIAYTCGNIGLIYSNQRLNSKALLFHQRALAISKKLQFKRGISTAANNIGIVYMNMDESKKAIDYYLLSVQLDKELNNDFGLSDTYNNIGIIYMNQKKFDKAAYYFGLTIPIRTRYDDKLGLATTYNNLGSLSLKKGELEQARIWLLKGLTLGQKIGSKEIIKYSYSELHEVESESGNIKQAFEFYKKFILYSDSIINENNTRLQTETEMQYNFDKKEAADKLSQEKRNLIAKKEKEQVQIILWSFIALAGITIVFSVFQYKRWKIVKTQKQVIEEKNAIVELKNREILDSISYAKRIQSAILPPERLVKEFLVNSFILYKPKDIVAGDFYWMEVIGQKIIFAAADCTGHGVPGALISVVCHNALNRSVREFGLQSPGEILDKTREIIIDEFAKSDDDVNDGMDISLCSLDLKTLELQWSGANNPLWIIRNESNAIEEHKANKQPIGKYSKYELFDNHTIQLQKDDSLYLFTDGFADQFGGLGMKKFKTKNMKTLLLSMQEKTMIEQRLFLDKTFEDWKGNQEQVDDVCVMGIRV